MTAPASPRYSGPFTATAGQTEFDVTFPLIVTSHARVYRRRGGGTSLLTLDVDYTVTAPTNPSAYTGRKIVLVTGATVGDKILILGAQPVERTTTFAAGSLATADLNAEFDAILRLVQEVRRDADRALSQSLFDTRAGSHELPDGESGAIIVNPDGSLDTGTAGDGGGAMPSVPLDIDDGGTGATTAPQALANLGAQPVDADLSAIAGLAEGAIGLLVRTAIATYQARAIAISGGLAVANPQGVAGNPELSIADRGVSKAKMALGTPNQYLGYDTLGQPAELSPVQQVKATRLGKPSNFGGGQNRVWLTDNNALWAVGAALRNGFAAATDVPQRVAFNVAPGTISKIVVSPTSVYVLDSAGKVWSFGGNGVGQLGHGDTTDRHVATRIEYFVTNSITVTDIVAAGDAGSTADHVFFLASTGNLYACGANGNGQLGVGNATQQNTPTLCSGVTSVASVAAAGNANPHALAIKTDGALYATGYNGEGQLGLGDTAQRTSFTLVSGFTNAAEARCASGNISSVPGGSSLVRKTDGSVYATGYNADGQLGQGNTTNRSAFTLISGLTAVEIAMSSDARVCTAAARKSDGTVVVWGRNDAGQCGTGNTTQQNSPQQPSGSFQTKATKVIVASGGGVAATNGVIVLTSDGEVWAAGYAANGNIGIGSSAGVNSTFTKCIGLIGTVTDLAAVGLGAAWGLTVIFSDGRTAVCGDNASGQLGLGVASQDALVFYDVRHITPYGPKGNDGSGVVAKGIYSGASAYVANDLVTHNGSAWRCIAGTTGNAPPTLPTTSNTWWELFVAKGDDGTDGVDGAPGLNWRAGWLTATAYVVGDGVSNGGSSYRCKVGHTSGASTEPGVGANWATNWDLLALKGNDGVGSGDVTAASAFANDNRLIRSDGTGKGVQASGVSIDDSNNVSGVQSLALLADPASALQAATKQYVDNLAAGLDVKASVKCATTANVTLSGEQTIDGVTTSASRVLVKSQTAPAENGVYVSAAGAWSRAADMDAWAEVPGSMVWVEEGTTNGDTAWVATANAGGTLGTTAITWSQFGGTGAFQAYSALLTAIAALSMVADRYIYGTGSGTVTLGTITAFARSVLDDADAATARATLAAEPQGEIFGENVQTASYTLVLADKGKRVRMNVASANNLTVPLNSSVAFPVGSRVEVFQYGAGQTTIVATGGVTIRSSGGKLKITGQYSAAILDKIGTDEWLLIGDIAA